MNLIKKKYLFLLSIASGLLLTFGWPANGFPLFLFIGFVPILIIEDVIFHHKKEFHRFSFFLYAFIAMIIWNSLTTYWIYYSTAAGVILAILLNSLFMSVTLSLFHYTRKTIKHHSSYLSFIVFWLAFEFIHLDWDLTWSWLNLGNGFANYPAWVQWYEYTGSLGGTLWVLMTNLLIFKAIRMFVLKEKTKRYRILFAAFCADLILVPILISLLVYYQYEDKGMSLKTIIVQPNIDPYNEKFDDLTSEEQIEKILTLVKLKIDNQPNLIVCPETAIPEGIFENNLNYSKSIERINLFIKETPSLSILIGASTYKRFERGEVKSATARESFDGDFWYDAYNSALFVDSTKNIQIYHKSKLVPGVEKMPFSKQLKFLEKYALDLGGIVGSLGIQNERSVFTSNDGKIKAAPVICYESIYGEFVSKYVRNGANVICIITNDGWWENTAGYKQHFEYARLRAIENRKSIIQSANTGISGFINQRGDVIQKTSWWKEEVLTNNVFLNDQKTIYVRYGDYIARTSYYISLVFILFTIFLSIKNSVKSRGSEK